MRRGLKPTEKRIYDRLRPRFKPIPDEEGTETAMHVAACAPGFAELQTDPR